MTHHFQIDRKAPEAEIDYVTLDEVAPIAALSAGRYAERQGLGLPREITYRHTNGRSSWLFRW